MSKNFGTKCFVNISRDGRDLHRGKNKACRQKVQRFLLVRKRPREEEAPENAGGPG